MCLDCRQTVDDVPLPGVWSVPDVILAETAGHVYRLLHGLERCCSLDSPSCVLTGLVVYDRLCRLNQGVVDQPVVERLHQTLTDAAGTHKTVQEDDGQSQSANETVNC